MSVKPCEGFPADREGVVKYQLDFRPGPAPRWPGYSGLEAWRRVLFRLRLIGKDPERYGGLSYGNLSQRFGSGFVISATQTGALALLAPAHYCLVERVDIEANRVVARGVRPPSSEALTHGAVYQAAPGVQVVMHGHCPDIWRHARRLGLPKTPPGAAYGTPALAAAVRRLVQTLPVAAILVMGGHPDGVLAYGPSPEQAGQLLVTTLARAWALNLVSDQEDKS